MNSSISALAIGLFSAISTAIICHPPSALSSANMSYAILAI
jgi:hypothetical protein